MPLFSSYIYPQEKNNCTKINNFVGKKYWSKNLEGKLDLSLSFSLEKKSSKSVQDSFFFERFLTTGEWKSILPYPPAARREETLCPPWNRLETRKKLESPCVEHVILYNRSNESVSSSIAIFIISLFFSFFLLNYST